jgi:hypothetical protein
MNESYIFITLFAETEFSLIKENRKKLDSQLRKIICTPLFKHTQIGGRGGGIRTPPIPTDPPPIVGGLFHVEQLVR